MINYKLIKPVLLFFYNIIIHMYIQIISQTLFDIKLLITNLSNKKYTLRFFRYTSFE